jgi:hypothetical protein
MSETTTLLLPNGEVEIHNEATDRIQLNIDANL